MENKRRFILVLSIQKKENFPKMKFHNKSFGRRETKTVFLSFLAAATALQLTSCADYSQIPEMPPLADDTSIVFSETVTTALPRTESEEITVQTQTQSSQTQISAETEVPAPIVYTETTEKIVREPFQTIYEYSSELENGVRRQKQQGVHGEVRVTTVTTYENGAVVDVSTQSETLTEKVDAIVIIGMKTVKTEKTVTQRGETVPFETKYIYDDTRYEDEREVSVRGQDGYTTDIYRVSYENGREVKRELISTARKEPITEEIIIGTKPVYTEKTQTVRENPIAYTTRYEYDETLDVGVRKQKIAGADGYTEKVYVITYYKGTEQKKELLSEKTVAPVEELILIGTKKEDAYYMPFRDAAHGGRDYAVTQSFSSSHRALDFGVWYGEPICAIKSGTVISAYNEGYFSTDNILWTYGTYVVIEHDDGMRSYYAHLKSKTVSVGQRVSGGQVIGYSGNTGRVNPAPTPGDPLAGTHLHFEIRVKQGGAYVTVDPRKYLPYWN
jgi:murein DD-endopeptidase MepM/ murein hydrolase activator NlpD